VREASSPSAAVAPLVAATPREIREAAAAQRALEKHAREEERREQVTQREAAKVVAVAQRESSLALTTDLPRLMAAIDSDSEDVDGSALPERSVRYVLDTDACETDMVAVTSAMVAQYGEANVGVKACLAQLELGLEQLARDFKRDRRADAEAAAAAARPAAQWDDVLSGETAAKGGAPQAGGVSLNMHMTSFYTTAREHVSLARRLVHTAGTGT
jgi:hypothetical protein